MNEKAWSDFEKTGSIVDYLSYKLCESAQEDGAFEASAAKPDFDRKRENISKKLRLSAGSFDNADKDKSDSSEGTGLQ